MKLKPIILIIIFSILISTGSTCFAYKTKNIISFSKNIVLGEKESVSDLISIFGDITVYGSVDNNVVAIIGNIYVKQGASIGGEIISIGGKVFRENGTIVAGNIQEITIFGLSQLSKIFKKTGLFWIFEKIFIFKIIYLSSLIVVSILIIALFEKNVKSIIYFIDLNLLRCLFFGILGISLFFPVLALLFLSIIGIPLIILWIIVYAILTFASYTIFACFVGERILASIGKSNPPLLFCFLAGFVVYYIADLLPVIGWLIKFLGVSTGLGGIILTKFGTLENKG